MVYYKWKTSNGHNKGRTNMVKENMCFDDFYDFYNRRKIIKYLYSTLSLKDKTLYKYYIYSRRTIKEKVCDMMWIYLNPLDNEQNSLYETLLEREYYKYL